MSVPARRVYGEMPAADFSAYDPDDARTFDALDVGERICAPSERGGSMLGATLLLLVLLGGAWGALRSETDWLAAIGFRVAAIAQLSGDPTGAPAAGDASSIATEFSVPGAPAPEAAPVSPPSPPADAAAPTPPAAEAHIETASVAAVAEPADPQPLPPVHVDPADPYQKRAAAAGLHPELSRVLLARLSASDYHNARYAVDTAIAKAPDDGEFIWPRQRRPEQALFRVHFVPGAAQQCRRYVVTVVKDGWSTTALPMERCGAELAATKSGAKQDGAQVSGR